MKARQLMYALSVLDYQKTKCIYLKLLMLTHILCLRIQLKIEINANLINFMFTLYYNKKKKTIKKKKRLRCLHCKSDLLLFEILYLISYIYDSLN